MGPADADPDAAVLARAQAGDARAFAQLVAAHQSRVRQQLRRLCHGDAALADDLAQDTFVQAWLALPGFRGEARVATWLYRIAYHRYLMDARATRRSPTLGPLPIAGLPGDDPPGERSVMPGHALRIDLQRAIGRLSEPQRLAIIHCHALELSHEEAATVLGWPLGTLKSHVARAKAQLREWLADWQPEAAA